MLLKKWDELPDFMRNDSVKPYYDALARRRCSLVCKRVFDIVLSAALLILFSPVFLLLSLAIIIDSKGGVFFRQTRVTAYGKRFRIHKFRTMVKNAEQIGSQVTVNNDCRVTKVGKIIRGCRLDEFPQLIDVLQGNMSFVGTRPEVEKYAVCYTDEMTATFLLPAGITSKASIAYKDENRLLSEAQDADYVYINKILPEKMKFNLEEIKNFSLTADIKTIFRTTFVLFEKEKPDMPSNVADNANNDCEPKNISICVIAYNEEKNIRRLFENLKEQDYPHEHIEIILVDGASTDKTKEFMLDFCADALDFYGVKVVDNPERIQPCGLNAAIRNSTCELILRVDAHSFIPPDFVRRNVECIERGHDICGGRTLSYTDDTTPIKRILFAANSSIFGGGGADFRVSEKDEYVKTLANGCYKREVFEKVGLYNPKLRRSEDNEIHYRMRKNSYKLYLDHKIHSDFLVRTSFAGMLRQKWGNGKYVGLTTKISPRVFSAYHYLPFLFTLAALICAILFATSFAAGLPWMRIPFYIGAAIYIALDALLTIQAVRQSKSFLGIFVLPVLFPALHFAYGLGTLYGFCLIPFTDLSSNETLN